MRGPLLAGAVALCCWLLLAAPVAAQQAADPLAALTLAGAPLLPAASVGSAPPAPAESSGAGSLGWGGPGGPPGEATEPAIGLGDLINPIRLLGGLDPGGWAGAVLTALVSELGQALLEAIHAFIDWALGLGGSGLNFVTRTPAQITYESEAVHSLWDFSRALANGGLALVVMWGGFSIIVRDHIGSSSHSVMELLPRVIVAALAANLTLELAALLIDTNNALTAAIGQTGLPGYQPDATDRQGIALVVVACVYAVLALALVFQMLMRLALIDVLIVLAPVMVLLWVLPQTQSWTRWWSHLLPITIFQQAVQMLVLRLGAGLVLEFPQGSVPSGLLSLLLGIAVVSLTLKMPALLHGQVGQTTGSGPSLIAIGRLAGGLGTGAAAARLSRAGR